MAGVSMDVHTGMAAITFLGVFQCWRQSHIPQVFKPLQMALEVHVYLSRQVASNELDHIKRDSAAGRHPECMICVNCFNVTI